MDPKLKQMMELYLQIHGGDRQNLEDLLKRATTFGYLDAIEKMNNSLNLIMKGASDETLRSGR